MYFLLLYKITVVYILPSIVLSRPHFLNVMNKRFYIKKYL